MKKNIYVVSKEYQKKDIYVYGLSKDSVNVFANITFHNGEVTGFVDDSGSVIGDSFMNRVIISEEEFEDTEAAVLVLPEFITKDSVKTDKEKVYWREILEVNLDIGEKNIYVYGLGEVGKKICKKLDEENIKIKGVCISTGGVRTVEWQDNSGLGRDRTGRGLCHYTGNRKERFSASDA